MCPCPLTSTHKQQIVDGVSANALENKVLFNNWILILLLSLISSLFQSDSLSPSLGNFTSPGKHKIAVQTNPVHIRKQFRETKRQRKREQFVPQKELIIR